MARRPQSRRRSTSEVPPPEPADGRTQRRLRTREQIRAAAYDLFTARGFDATKTSAIAQHAGVAHGTIFVHASDKPDLLFLVMHDRLEQTVDERWSTLPDAPLLERLMHLFAGLFQMYGEHPDLAGSFIRHIPGAKGPNAQRVDALSLAFLQRLARLVEDGQALGELAPDLPPLRCAHNLFGLYYMALMAWVAGHASLDVALDPFLREALALQIRGFLP